MKRLILKKDGGKVILNKKLIKIVDVLGRVVEKSRNTLLFYIYDDGTVEKRMLIE